MQAPESPLRLTFAELSEAWLEQVAEIERFCSSAPWSVQAFQAEVHDRESEFLLALDDGRVVGFAGLWLVIDEAHVVNVGVHPDYRRKGVGMQMMQELLERAIRRGAKCAMLEVRAGNVPAIRMYEKLGFAVAGRRKAYYPDNQEDALVMWKHGLE